MSNVTYHEPRRRYEMQAEGGLAFAQVREESGRLMIDHVEVPAALRGKGVAGDLMAGVMADAKSRGVAVVPICSYAAAWMKRHPDA